MKLPVVEQEGGINPTRGAMLDLNTAGQMGQVVGNIGQQIGVYAEAWQKVQNASEQLAGKNDLDKKARALIKEATEYSGWTSSKDIQTKEDDIRKKMSELMGNITSGFRSTTNAQDFTQKYSERLDQYQNQLDGIFRSKYIDNTNATLIESAQHNKEAFISSGDEAFRRSYMDDIGTAYSAGFITETNYTKYALDADEWGKYRAFKMAEEDPQGAVEYLSQNPKLNTEENRNHLNALIANAKQRKLNAEIISNSVASSGLLNDSATQNLTVEEVESRMPANATPEFKSLIYKMNGLKEGGKSLSHFEKASRQQELNDEFAALVSNPNTTIEDFGKFEAKVYKAMNDGVDTDACKNILNNLSGPTMQAWENYTKQYGNSVFFGNNYGYDKLNKWIKKDVLGDDPKEKKYKNRMSEYKALVAGRNRIKTNLYSQYNDALVSVAREKNLQSVADILALPKNQQNEIYKQATDIVMQQYANDRFSSLRNKTINPTYVLSGGSLTQVADNPDDKGTGTKLNETRVKQVAYDPDRGVYGLVMSDGTIKEVGYEEYKMYGGTK